MKKEIKSTADALSFLLQGLYHTETRLKEIFPVCCPSIGYEQLRAEITRYTGCADNKLLKLERVFNYLLTDPISRKNAAVDELLAEMHHVLEATPAGHVRDVLSIGYIQNINMYKITTYRSAYKLSIELELDTATDLLQQILSWEEKTSHALAQLAAEIFSQSNQTELKS